MNPTQYEEEFSLKGYFIPFTSVKAIIFIVLIGFAVFFNSFFNGFVGDDWGQIVDNVPVHSLQNTFSFFTKSTFYVNGAGSFGAYYKPFMLVIYSVLYTFFGQTAFFYHLVQSSIHIANACLLFIFFKYFFDRKLSFFLSLTFLVHPINSEAVYYVACMQEVLFFLFGIIAILVMNKKSNIRNTLIIGILWFFSLLSKETGTLFIVISSLYNHLFKKTYSIYGVAGVVLVSYMLLRVSAVGFNLSKNEMYLTANSTFSERLISIPKIVFFYLYSFMSPFNRTIQQSWVVREVDLKNFYSPLIADLTFLLALTLLAVYFYKKNTKIFREYIFFFIWFLLGLTLHLQIIPLDAVVSDRWFYFPIVGLIGIIGVLLSYFWEVTKTDLIKKIFIIISISVVILLMYLSFMRGFDFRNDFTLCSHDINIDQKNYVLELCLGNEYRKLKQFDIARTHFKKSISFFPKYYIAMYYLGLSYSDQNNYKEAIKYFRQTLDNNNWGYGADQLATLLSYHGGYKEAKTVATENLEKQPRNAQLWYALALSDYQLGDKEKALSAAKNAYLIAPNNLTKQLYEGIQEGLPLKFDGR